MKGKTGGLIQRKVNRRDFFHSFLKLLEANYSEKNWLTNSERNTLVEFMLLSNEDLKYKYNLFGINSKKKVAEKMGIKISNLEFKIHSIRKKGYLKKDMDNIEGLNDTLNKIVDTNGLEITLQFKIEENV